MKNVPMIRPKRKETRKTVGWNQRIDRVPGQSTTFEQLVSPYEMELISQPDVIIVSFVLVKS